MLAVAIITLTTRIRHSHQYSVGGVAEKEWLSAAAAGPPWKFYLRVRTPSLQHQQTEREHTYGEHKKHSAARAVQRLVRDARAGQAATGVEWYAAAYRYHTNGMVGMLAQCPTSSSALELRGTVRTILLLVRHQG